MIMVITIMMMMMIFLPGLSKLETISCEVATFPSQISQWTTAQNAFTAMNWTLMFKSHPKKVTDHCSHKLAPIKLNIFLLVDRKQLSLQVSHKQDVHFVAFCSRSICGHLDHGKLFMVVFWKDLKTMPFVLRQKSPLNHVPMKTHHNTVPNHKIGGIVTWLQFVEICSKVDSLIGRQKWEHLRGRF